VIRTCLLVTLGAVAAIAGMLATFAVLLSGMIDDDDDDDSW